MKYLDTIIFFLVITSACRAQNPYEDYKRTWKGKQLPSIQLETFDGHSINNETLKGKVVLLNFWFTSCPGCKIAYPGLQKLKNRFENQDEVAFISIANDDAATLSLFLQKNPINFDHISSGKAVADNSFGILGYPTNFIIDEHGVIQHVKIGGSTQSADDIEYEMKLLLKNN